MPLLAWTTGQPAGQGSVGGGGDGECSDEGVRNVVETTCCGEDSRQNRNKAGIMTSLTNTI